MGDEEGLRAQSVGLAYGMHMIEFDGTRSSRVPAHFGRNKKGFVTGVREFLTFQTEGCAALALIYTWLG